MQGPCILKMLFKMNRMKQMKYVSKSIYRLKYELEKDCYNNNNYRLTVISWTFNNKAMLTVGIFVDLA